MEKQQEKGHLEPLRQSPHEEEGRKGEIGQSSHEEEGRKGEIVPTRVGNSYAVDQENAWSSFSKSNMEVMQKKGTWNRLRNRKMKKEENRRECLPEEIVEEILARVPFPDVLQTRTLSKSWQAKLSPIATLADKEEKHLAIYFQDKVAQRSTQWQTFCPVYVFERYFIAFDPTSEQWLRMPPMSFLVELFSRGSLFPNIRLISGALVLISIMVQDELSGWHCDVYVANIVTSRWKKLPPAPQKLESEFDEYLLIPISSEMYKLVVLAAGAGTGYCAQIYDSNSGAWSSKELEVQPEFDLISCSAYLNGILYKLIRATETDDFSLLAFNIKQEIFEVLPLPLIDFPLPLVEYDMEMDIAQLVVCNLKLLVIVYNNHPLTKSFLNIIEINPASLRWLPIRIFNFSYLEAGLLHGFELEPPQGNVFEAIICDDNSIFFYMGEIGNKKIVAYNVLKDKWSCIPNSPFVESEMAKGHEWEFCSFQPSLNPFVEP